MYLDGKCMRLHFLPLIMFYIFEGIYIYLFTFI